MVGTERECLLKRFDSVINQFRGVLDAKSGEVLLGPNTIEAVNNLRKHTPMDCISGLEGVPLCYTRGEAQRGLLLVFA